MGGGCCHRGSDDVDAIEHPFAKSISARLRAAGIDAELVSSTPDSQSFGNADATFRWGPLILLFVRDRGEEFIEVASAAVPARLFLYDDLSVAMSWQTISEVTERESLESVENMLARLKDHAAQIHDAFSDAQERFTRGRLERASRERGAAMIKVLQRS